jgi:hypothetical protein
LAYGCSILSRVRFGQHEIECFSAAAPLSIDPRTFPDSVAENQHAAAFIFLLGGASEARRQTIAILRTPL